MRADACIGLRGHWGVEVTGSRSLGLGLGECTVGAGQCCACH